LKNNFFNFRLPERRAVGSANTAGNSASIQALAERYFFWFPIGENHKKMGIFVSIGKVLNYGAAQKQLKHNI